MRKKLKIAVIIPSLDPTGLVRVALDLRLLFIDKGHTVNVFYFDEKPHLFSISDTVKISFKDKLIFAEYDVLHSHGLRPDLYVRRNRKKIIPPTVTTLHNYVEEDLKYSYGKVVAFAFSKVWNWAAHKHSACVVLSENMKEYYQKFWLNKNLIVINNTRKVQKVKLDKKLVNEILAFKKDLVLLGTFCGVSERKGLDQVLQLLKDYKQYAFVLFGAGAYLEKLKNNAKNLGVSNRVLFMGYNKDAMHYSQVFDVMVMPSLSEGFPLALLEVVQLKVPVVHSNLPVIKEIFNKNEVARFELQNIVEFNAAIDFAIKNKRELTQNAFNRFRENYSSDIVSEKYLSLYSDLITN